MAVLLGRTRRDKARIRAEISRRFGYRLAPSLEAIRRAYAFDISCQGTVPAAIIAFLEFDSFEDAIRNAVSLGGDSDTLACTAGGVAEAYHGGAPTISRTRCGAT